MSKFKKVLALLLVVALTAALSVSLTMAYLQDTDEQVNVMTLGNVYIDQHEYQRAEGVAYDAGEPGAGNGVKKGALVDFEQGQALYPAVPANNAATDYTAEMDNAKLFYWGDYVHTGTAGNGLWNDSKLANVMDKMIFVENTGKSDCYFRTIIAFECPEGMEYSQGPDKEFMNNVNGGDTYGWINVGYVSINDTRYMITVATYQKALKPGNQSHPSLLQVVMTHNATNEDMELLGDSYEILALSQAVQTEGFADAETALDTAFGKITAENVKDWMEGNANLNVPTVTSVSTVEELKTALTAGGIVVLEEDVTVTETMNIPAGADTYLNLNGNDLSYTVSNDGKAAAIINNKGTLEIAGEGTISFIADNPDLGTIPAYATNTITNTGKLIIGEGVTVTNDSDGGASYAVDNHGEFILNGGTLIGDRCALRVAKYNQDNVVFVMNSGTIEAKTPAWIQLPGSNSNAAPKITVTINGGTLQSTKTPSEDNNVLYTYSYGNSHANTTITINGGEFLGGTVSIGSGYKDDAPKMIINGGIFEYDVLQWLEGDTYVVLFEANKE
ncbi:MAG: hypothetical protein E7459_09310 [Ruminococcaceae bacterium]|nr:hypothetical protein [Oscillospiraceae bacterium]